MKAARFDSSDRRCYTQITVRSEINCQIINLKRMCIPSLPSSRSLAELSCLLMLISLLPLAPLLDTGEFLPGQSQKAEEARKAVDLFKCLAALGFF